MDCDRYQCLPLAGGVLDQPAGLMRRLRMVLNVYHALKRYLKEGKKPGEMARWRRENEEAWMIVSEINELRERYG